MYQEAPEFIIDMKLIVTRHDKIKEVDFNKILSRIVYFFQTCAQYLEIGDFNLFQRKSSKDYYYKINYGVGRSYIINLNLKRLASYKIAL